MSVRMFSDVRDDFGERMITLEGWSTLQRLRDSDLDLKGVRAELLDVVCAEFGERTDDAATELVRMTNAVGYLRARKDAQGAYVRKEALEAAGLSPADAEELADPETYEEPEGQGDEQLDEAVEGGTPAMPAEAYSEMARRERRLEFVRRLRHIEKEEKKLGITDEPSTE